LEAWVPIPCLQTLCAVEIAAEAGVEVTVTEAAPEVLAEGEEEEEE
jgi:hypothetical protein